MSYFLDYPRAFGINADQWTTAAQDEGDWRKTAEQGAERFMAKWIATAEKVRASLRHAVVCPNVTRRVKDRMTQSKRVRAGSLATLNAVARTKETPQRRNPHRLPITAIPRSGLPR